MPRKSESASFEEDPTELIYDGVECDSLVFPVIRAEDRKKWVAYLQTHHGVDVVNFYGKDDLNLTIIAAGYVHQGRYSRYSDELDREEEVPAFVVSMERVARISPEWEKLISGLVAVVDTGGAQIITIPIAASDVFHVILAIAHEVDEQVPKEMELGTLSLLAKASLKYSMVSLLRPWADMWLAGLGVRRGQLPDVSEDPVDFVVIYRWMWVAYAFGLPDVMSMMTFKMAYATKWIGRPQTLPVSLYDHIHRIRARYLEDLTKTVYEYHNRITCLLGVVNRSAIPCEVCSSGSPQCVKAQHELLTAWFNALKLPLYKFNDDVAGKVLPAGPVGLVNCIKLVPQGPRAGNLCKGTRRKGCGLADVANVLPCDGEEHLRLAHYMEGARFEYPTLKKEHFARMARHRAILEKK